MTSHAGARATESAAETKIEIKLMLGNKQRTLPGERADHKLLGLSGMRRRQPTRVPRRPLYRLSSLFSPALLLPCTRRRLQPAIAGPPARGVRTASGSVHLRTHRRGTFGLSCWRISRDCAPGPQIPRPPLNFLADPQLLLEVLTARSHFTI